MKNTYKSFFTCAIHKKSSLTIELKNEFNQTKSEIDPSI